MGSLDASECRHGDLTSTPVEMSAKPAETADSPTEKAYTLDACGQAEEAGDLADKRTKPPSFYLAFTCLLIMVLLCALDSTIMAVSIPVGHSIQF